MLHLLTIRKIIVGKKIYLIIALCLKHFIVWDISAIRCHSWSIFWRTAGLLLGIRLSPVRTLFHHGSQAVAESLADFAYIPSLSRRDIETFISVSFSVMDKPHYLCDRTERRMRQSSIFYWDASAVIS